VEQAAAGGIRMSGTWDHGYAEPGGGSTSVGMAEPGLWACGSTRFSGPGGTLVLVKV
jgi:hypothetical protein